MWKEEPGRTSVKAKQPGTLKPDWLSGRCRRSFHNLLGFPLGTVTRGHSLKPLQRLHTKNVKTVVSVNGWPFNAPPPTRPLSEEELGAVAGAQSH